MNFFDLHVHIGRWLTPDFCGRDSGLEEFVQLYESLGALGALLMPTDGADNEGLKRSIEGTSTKLILKFAFWVLPDNYKDLERLSPDALKFHPSFLRTPVDDPVFRPFFEYAVQHGLFAVVHCGRWREVSGFERAIEVASKYPGVTFVLSHMGGDSPCLVKGAVDMLAEGGPVNVLLGTESIREFWLVEYAVERLGAARVVFGSDYNLNAPSAFLGVIRDARLSQDAKKAILKNNALKLLGISKTPS